MSRTNELPLYLAMYKLQKYLYLIIKHFPKDYKYNLGSTILEIGWVALDCIIEVNELPNPEKRNMIGNASIAFDKLKTRLRMAYELKLISPRRYSFIIIQNTEIGSMINGWLKWAIQYSDIIKKRVKARI